MRSKRSLSKLGKNNPMYGKKGELNPTWKGDKERLPNCELCGIKLSNLHNKRCKKCVKIGIKLSKKTKQKIGLKKKGKKFSNEKRKSFQKQTELEAIKGLKISELQKKSHKIAIKKGFWGKLAKHLGENSSLKNNRNLGELLMLIVSELAEALEALRLNKRQKGIKWKKNTFEDELADTIIRIADLAESQNIDLEWQLRKKITYNEKRKYKHGKRF